jgi:hypothetical protein
MSSQPMLAGEKTSKPSPAERLEKHKHIRLAT